MGYRTVVVLYNDQALDWENDPELGKKIARAMVQHDDWDKDLNYGRVVECEHADTQTLAVLDGYSFTPIEYSQWRTGDALGSVAYRLIASAAKKLGYRLTKIKESK